MNFEKVMFAFFIVLALTLNFGFFIGDIDNPAHHDGLELAAALAREHYRDDHEVWRPFTDGCGSTRHQPGGRSAAADCRRHLGLGGQYF